MEAAYNDIAGWKYKELPRVLGASEGDVDIHDVRTRVELETLLLDRYFAEARNIQVCVVLPLGSEVC